MTATTNQRGITLVELMIVVAILSIIAAIAIPAYNGYILEARIAAARTNAESLRIFLEDFQLDNGTYRVAGLSAMNGTQLQEKLNWKPDGDQGQYSYNVTVTSNSYAIVVEHSATGHWLRCEDRMNTCCDSSGSGSKTSCSP